MKSVRLAVATCLFLLLLSACSTSRVVKPLDEGKLSFSADAGGPIFNYKGNDIPMPLSSVSMAYGLNRDHTLFTGLHTTQLVYGVGHVDIGMVRSLYRPSFNVPGFSITPAVNFMLDKWERHFKLYPSVDINAYWDVFDRRDYFYVGMSNWFELARERAHGEDQPNFWIPSLHTGYTLVTGRMNYTLEAKYLAPLHSNEDIVVDYLSPTDNGAVGVYMRVSVTFR